MIYKSTEATSGSHFRLGGRELWHRREQTGGYPLYNIGLVVIILVSHDQILIRTDKNNQVLGFTPPWLKNLLFSSSEVTRIKFVRLGQSEYA